MDKPHSDGIAAIFEVVHRLRAPGGCPWDREQTHDSIKHHLLEEAYEAVDAMDAGDPEMLAEELGDLLLQVVFHSQLAVSNEEFTLADGRRVREPREHDVLQRIQLAS